MAVKYNAVSAITKGTADKTEKTSSLSSPSLVLFLLGCATFLYLQLFMLPWTPIFIVQDH